MILDQIDNTLNSSTLFGGNQAVGDIASGSFDTDAVNYINSVLAINGSEVTANERIATSNFFRELKQIGVFNPDSMPVLCPILGRVNAASNINYMQPSLPIVPHADYVSNELGFKNNNASLTRDLRVNQGQLTWGANYVVFAAGFNINQINENNFANGKVSYIVAGNFYRHFIDSSTTRDFGSLFNTFGLIAHGRINDNTIYIRANRVELVPQIAKSWGDATFNYMPVGCLSQGYLSVLVVIRNATLDQYSGVGDAIIKYLTAIERYKI
jgi:hypothetical protein